MWCALHSFFVYFIYFCLFRILLTISGAKKTRLWKGCHGKGNEEIVDHGIAVSCVSVITMPFLDFLSKTRHALSIQNRSYSVVQVVPMKIRTLITIEYCCICRSLVRCDTTMSMQTISERSGCLATFVKYFTLYFEFLLFK